MTLILFLIIMAILTAMLFGIQAVIYEKWYESEDENDEH